MESQGTRFIIYAPVNRVEKVGDLWYVNFLGSWESLAFGEEKPFEVGDKVKITFERIKDEMSVEQPK